MREVQPPRAARMLADGSAVLLDVREPDEWQAGHVGGALHIPLALVARSAGDLPVDTTIVVVCRSGRRSAVAVRTLRRAGHKAENLSGGMRAWVRCGLPLERPGGKVI